jgi:hypothetical protein
MPEFTSRPLKGMGPDAVRGFGDIVFWVAAHADHSGEWDGR